MILNKFMQEENFDDWDFNQESAEEAFQIQVDFYDTVIYPACWL